MMAKKTTNPTLTSVTKRAISVLTTNCKYYYQQFLYKLDAVLDGSEPPLLLTYKETDMSVELSKRLVAGERVNLSKEHTALTKYAIGLEWHEKAGITADCDLSIVLLNGAGKAVDMVYYNKQETAGVKSYGDNLTGADDEIATPTNSDEQVDIDLSALNPDIESVLVIATTHSENADKTPGIAMPFGRVAKPLLTVFNNSDSANAKPLYSFELDEAHSTATAVEIAKFYKRGADWIYVSMADEVGTNPIGLQSIADKYGL